jgi:hypothetical protein
VAAAGWLLDAHDMHVTIWGAPLEAYQQLTNSTAGGGTVKWRLFEAPAQQCWLDPQVVQHAAAAVRCRPPVRYPGPAIQHPTSCQVGDGLHVCRRSRVSAGVGLVPLLLLMTRRACLVYRYVTPSRQRTIHGRSRSDRLLPCRDGAGRARTICSVHSLPSTWIRMLPATLACHG